MTRLGIEARKDRAALTLAGGPLTGKVISVGPDRARIGLVATQALLLGGDDVRLDVRVGPGAHLELVELAGVVAYHGRGRPASWTVTIDVAENGSLIWHGEPFVVADGADVTRASSITLGRHAVLVQRETLVFGRTREAGGDLHTRVRAAQIGMSVCGTPLLAEDLALHRTGRAAIGVLGGGSGVDRIVDSIAVLGRRPAKTPVPPGVVRLDLDGDGAVFRWTGTDLAGSPLPRLWPGVSEWDRHPVSVGFGTMDG